MKPNSPITREALLRRIRETLLMVAAESKPDARTSAQEGPLGDTVRRLMASFSQSPPNSHPAELNSNPIPLYDVAAYVDGTLDDQYQVDAITRLATTDPGLMMEIVSALRSSEEIRRSSEEFRRRREEPSSRGISPDLKSRLLALHARAPSARAPSAQTQSAQTQSAQASGPQVSSSIEERQPVEPAGSKTESETPSAETVLPSIEPARTGVSPRPAEKIALGTRWRVALLFTSAAALLVAIGWWIRSTMPPDERPIAEDRPSRAPAEIRPPEPIDPLEPSGSRDPVIAVGPESDDAQPIELTPPDRDASSKNVAMNRDPQESPTRVPEEPLVNVEPDTETPMVPPNMTPPQTTIDPPSPLLAQWDEIDGLLLRSTVSMPGLSRPEESSSSDSPARGVVSGTALTLASDIAGQRLRLQTLPLCRATAKLAGGGELVIAADTQVDLTFGGTIDLQHGSIALIGLNPDTVFRLGRALGNSVSLQGQTGGSVVVRKTTGGLEMDVLGEEIQVDGQAFSDSRLSVTGRTLATSRIDDAPDRLPRWTRERVDRIEVGRNVLAQLSESPDVRATMMQSLRSGAVQGKAATTMRHWIVTSSNGDLLRLIGSSDPLIREAALQHLRATAPTDPRHRPLWNSLQQRSKNARTFVAVRSYFVELSNRRRPNANRRDQLLRMLQAPEPATRVTADYLLRGFYGNGPRFDLNATPTARTRSVNAWRAVINRVDR